MNQIPIALQMYSLREETEKDFAGTLKKVAEMGYDGVEFAGYGGYSAKELKDLLNRLGLKAASSHVPLETLETDLDQVIDYQQKLGSKHIVCPHLAPDRQTDEGYRELVTVLNTIGKTCFEAGITFSYHNHDFELEPVAGGQSALDMLFTETNPKWVQTELDIYWLAKAGEDPVEWIKRYHNRTPLIHLKDMTTDEEQFFAELGTGGIDLESVMKVGAQSNVEWWIVEQDQSRKTPLESVKQSIDFLKQRGE